MHRLPIILCALVVGGFAGFFLHSYISRRPTEGIEVPALIAKSDAPGATVIFRHAIPDEKLKRQLHYQLRKGRVFQDGTEIITDDWKKQAAVTAAQRGLELVFVTPDPFETVGEFTAFFDECRRIEVRYVVVNIPYTR